MDRLQQLLAAATAAPVAVEQGAEVDQPPPRVVFPGAFAPLHGGHLRIARYAAARLQQRVEFEISLKNVDKRDLTATLLADRLSQFGAKQIVWVTRAATFEEKARYFSGVTFLVGADTVARIADPAYYGSGISGRDQAVGVLNSQSCRFLVFGRLLAGEFVELDGLNLPASLRDLCWGVSQQDFRLDLSSTELRKTAGP